MQTYKDVEIRGHKYRIGLMDALSGSNVVSIVLPKVMGVMAPGEKLNMGMIVKLLPSIAGDDLKVIQTESLKSCFTYMEGAGGVSAPVPIMKHDGTWANQEIRYDLVLAITLTAHSVGFNLAPFFDGEGLGTIFSSLMGEPSSL